MDWAGAFLFQAKSDYNVLKTLQLKGVEYSHQLHYVQMVTEKLAKGIRTSISSSATPPEMTHTAFVKMLRLIKGRPEVRKRLGYEKNSVFANFIDGALTIS